MKHKILHTEFTEDHGIVLTTHERVKFDTITEQFIVDLGNNSWCEVRGRNRFTRAIDIADKISIDLTQPKKE